MVSGSQKPSMFLIFIFIMRMKTTNKWTWEQVSSIERVIGVPNP